MNRKPEQAVFFSSLDPLMAWDKPCDRIYFGHEFCQRLLPAPETLLNAVARARELGKPFSFVTPFVTNAGLRSVSQLFQALAGASLPEPPEIIVNDWGVLRMLNREFPGWPAALGRLLTRQKRGPRLMRVRDRMPAPAMDHLMRSPADSPHMRGFLEKLSVRRLELDNLLQGIKREPDAMPASLYHPFVYVSTTRLCLLMRGDQADKNFRSLGRCSRECLRYDVTLTHHEMPVPLLLKGNAYLFRNDTLPEHPERLGIDRLVFQAEPLL